MVSVARKSLFADKLRFAISAGGVALSVALILVVNGFFVGMNRQITAYLDNTGADLLVAQKDTRNFLGTRSAVPLWRERDIARTRGVADVFPVLASYAVLDIAGRKEFALLVGYDPAKGGGPWRMLEGGTRIGNDEVIIDLHVAHQYGLELGDTVDILGKDFRVAGLAGGASSWMTGTFFLDFDATSRLLARGRDTGFFLVRLERGADPIAVRRALERTLDGPAVTPTTRVRVNDLALYAQIFNAPLGFMVTVAFLVGVVLVALTTYTATVERAREYGVLKAVGTSNPTLYLMVFQQALIASVTGFTLGAGLSYGISALIARLAPKFLVTIEPSAVASLFLVALAMGVLGSWVPVRTVARIDPAIAFKRGV